MTQLRIQFPQKKMKSNFKKLLNKYALFKNSFLKDLRLRKQKVKSIWSKANTFKNNKLIKNKNLNTFQNFISEIDFKKYNFIKKLDIKSSKNISNKKSKAVAKAKSLDKVEIFFKKLFKINSFKKYKISPEIFKNNFKSKLSKIDFKNIDLFLDKYLSEKIANQIKNFYKDNFKNTNRKEINSVDFLGIYYAWDKIPSNLPRGTLMKQVLFFLTKHF